MEKATRAWGWIDCNRPNCGGTQVAMKLHAAVNWRRGDCGGAVARVEDEQAEDYSADPDG